jgi:hypothetical protein
MANQATVATGTYDPFTNGRGGVLRQLRKSLPLPASRLVFPFRPPPVSTATRARPLAGVRDWDEPTHRAALERLLQASAGSFPSVVLS